MSRIPSRFTADPRKWSRIARLTLLLLGCAFLAAACANDSSDETSHHHHHHHGGGRSGGFNRMENASPTPAPL